MFNNKKCLQYTETIDKTWLTEYQVPFYKSTFVNDLINDHNLDLLCLTETWLKPDEYIILNESTPQDYCYKNEPRPKGKGGGVATIYNNILSISQKTGFKYNSFEVMVLHINYLEKKVLMINPP